jgi:aminoglycoside 3'-phosphotransferase-2
MTDAPETLARELLMLDDGADAAAAVLKSVTGGMSGTAVFRATRPGRPPRYLKIAHDRDSADALRAEIARTAWLGERGVAVAEILHVLDRGDRAGMLTAAMTGLPADTSPLPTPLLIAALAKTMAALHALPPGLCPFDETLAIRLGRAQRAIAEGSVDPAAFEPRNRAARPADLLRRLTAAPPRESIVVVHGDATLSNIIIDNDGTTGLIDCGNSGRADRYTDLAVLYADIQAHRGAEAAEQFIHAYGLHAYDAAKARYYGDLYEFF